ncbi:hypothetical protein SB719_22680, partial [Pantoea sp. SIMBA_079]|uniref:hypothetical protein n=1 Tax=Pantoea sp. SIMBA_079 TaxID=3085817 RepID=UPI003992580A
DRRETTDAAWRHDLRNAINAVTLAVASGQRMLADGHTTRAGDALARADEALRRVRVLLESSEMDGRRSQDTPAD